MDIKQINQTLTRIFKEEKKRIVFWFDGEKEFEESLSSVQVEHVSLLRLDEINAPHEPSNTFWEKATTCLTFSVNAPF